MSKYKYRFGNGLAFSECKDLKMIEDMAQKGFAPIGANAFGFYKFAPSAVEAVDYSMDIFQNKTDLDGFEEYKEIFKSGGWEYVFSVESFHFFKAKKGTTPIYTDKPNESIKHRNMKAVSLKIALGALAISIFLFILIWLLTMPRIIWSVLAILSAGFFGVGLAMSIGAILNWVRTIKCS